MARSRRHRSSAASPSRRATQHRRQLEPGALPPPTAESPPIIATRHTGPRNARPTHARAFDLIGDACNMRRTGTVFGAPGR